MDEVIRRELRFREGDAYNVTKINRSKQRLENLGFFEKVDFQTKRIGDTDKVNLEIELKEKKTGELNLGVGYSTVNRLTLSTGIKERNLFGTGQELGFNIQKSFASLTSDINYTKPHFMNLPIDVGFDLFKYSFTQRNSLFYDQASTGVTFRGDYAISEFFSHQLRYSYSEQSISNVYSGASISLKLLEGSYTSSGIGQTFAYDRRDNRMNPRDGYYASVSQDYNGIGGNINTIKHEGSAGYYVPVTSKDYVFKLVARGGMIEGLGGQGVRSNYGFFLGGNNFRGFQYAGMGPRIMDSSGNAKGGGILGGKIYYVGTAEFMFPLGLPRELGINGILFSDNGTVKGVDQQNLGGASVADSGSLRSSYGFSIAWSSPLGPIRLDFSRIAKKEVYDQTQVFRFSFGTNF
jgi:outer membrane protein insertion porin family